MAQISEIKALVSLLADDDTRIGAMVWDNLVKLGADAIPALREATEAADPRLRTRARHVLDRLAFEQVQVDLRRLVEVPEDAFDLEGALHALARLEDPDLPRDQVAAKLNELAGQLRPRGAALRHPLDRIASMNAMLFGEMRYALVQRSHADFRHFCLHRVLELRAGAPALLTSVYLLAADRLDLPLGVWWLPGHDMLHLDASVSGAGSEVFIDAARSGRVLSRRECVQTCLRDYHPKESYMHSVGRRDLVVRAVRGMMLLCARTKDRVRSERLARLLEILQTRERTR